MTIWITVIEDRHIDVDVRPFSDMPAAIAYARDWTSDERDVSEMELTDAMARDGWVFYAEYGTEGDCVRVVERELDGPLSRSLARVNEIL
jgi:hypothetical protein